MRQRIRLQLIEKHVANLIPEYMGRKVGGWIRDVVLDIGDPAVRAIGVLQEELMGREDTCFYGWGIDRIYSDAELSRADLLLMQSNRMVQPAGEECGTKYDDAMACPECGSGAPQTTRLHLRGASNPKSVDVADTIARSETVMSSRFVRLVREEKLGGLRFSEVALFDQSGSASEAHFQFGVAGRPVEVHASTQVGSCPFDRSSFGKCGSCELIGLNRLSEVRVVASSVSDADFLETRQMVGVRRGLLRPRRLFLVSQRAWRAIIKAKLKGFVFEVAHLV